VQARNKLHPHAAGQSTTVTIQRHLTPQVACDAEWWRRGGGGQHLRPCPTVNKDVMHAGDDEDRGPEVHRKGKLRHMTITTKKKAAELPQDRRSWALRGRQGWRA